jgi:predicted nucleic acid-binding protein
LRRAADSSVAIAALLADHEDHEKAERALRSTDATVAHAAIETYGVLTRLPPPRRVGREQAALLIDARLPADWLTLDGRAQAVMLRRLASEGVSGGASYDGLIALTALEHEAELLTLDRRATRAYVRLGVRFVLVGDQ